MKKDHIELLFKTGELNSLLYETEGLSAILNKMVNLIAEYMNVDVCSIYLYNEDEKKLILMATKGLKKSAVGNVRLNIGEGLAGLALKELSYICEKTASKSKYYKYFPNINEEKYESFLAVPILHGFNKVGVLVVQRKEKNFFAEKDILTLRALAAQLANTIEITNILIQRNQLLNNKTEKTKVSNTAFFKGQSAYKGIVYAKISILQKNIEHIFQICGKQRKCTLNDFEKSVQLTKIQLNDLQKKAEDKLSEGLSLIFTAHLLMLDDKKFTGAMRDLIIKGKCPAVSIKEIGDKYIKIFSESSNDYIKEKMYDVEDLMKRLLNNLHKEHNQESNYKDRIVITRDIFPSDLLKLSSEDVKGIILVSGGITSHIAILARSLRIPLIIIDNPEILYIPKNSKILMDSERGNIFVNPDNETLKKFNTRKISRKKIGYFKYSNALNTITLDNKKITLKANINLLSEVKFANKLKFPAIGLYRTEFPFMIRNNFPSEEEQFKIYKKLITDFDNKPVVFRTLDIGGDKFLNYYSDLNESNPFLGLRSIRFSIANKDIFEQQINAILRAGADSDISIMFPLISSLDEFIFAKNFIKTAIKKLKKENMPINDNPKIGVMVEVPSLVEIIDVIANEADFLSIGTNDLIQYLLAADRTNSKVADFYIPYHPAVLRTLKKIADAGIKHNIEVTICGDMAHNIKYIPFLLGIGISSLSIDSLYLTDVKEVISKLNIKQSVKKANNILKLSSVKAIENEL